MFKPVSLKENFPEMEKKILERWYKTGLVKKYLSKNKNSPKKFSFIDGPITANNPMGVHHAWGRTYKDLWNRYHNMKGDALRFQAGFDCQGLWVEVEVEKELGLKNKKDIENLIPDDKKASIAKFVDLCKERVLKYSKIQTEQSKRLGFIMDWDNSYHTMSDENNYLIWHFLKVCFEKGWIYKGKDSVPWCPRCETAISQHEMLTEDYKEVLHRSIYFKLPIIGRKNEYLLVWTTTPWTLPANIAVAVDEKMDYSQLEDETGDLIWIAKELVETVFKGKYKKIVKSVKGKELVGLKYTAPFDFLPKVKQVAEKNPGKFHIVVATDQNILPITVTEGTGMVHTAVSAGSEDYKLGQKLGLPMVPVIADNADYLEGLDFLSGKNAKKHPEIIFDYLISEDKKEKKWIYKIENYKHRYPACWRCKAELVWKVANEWYIAMDKIDPTDNKKRTLREEMKDVAKEIRWIPTFGLERELDWLSNMHDWLISKPNRYWGLALPIYECKKCKEVTVIGSKEELKERAISGWDKFEGHTPHKPWIDEVKIKCKKCGQVVERLPDVGNVWLDAGIVTYSTLIDPETKKISYLSDKKYWKEWFPADFITESFPGQFKNWFYSLISMSTVLERKAPFKTVLGFATLLGEDGRPMHKSWGNAIEFNEGANIIGADVMRWTYCIQNPSQNLCFGYRVNDETRRKFYLLIWNSYNFFITYANLDKWHKKTEIKNLSYLDKWILTRLDEVIIKVTISLDDYNPQDAALSLEKFVSDLSTWYIRRSRDRIGPSASDLKEKEKTYYTLYTIFEVLCRLLAPFVPYLSDEIYTNITGLDSVHLQDWPKESNEKSLDKNLLSDMEKIRSVSEIGHSERKRLMIKVRQPLAKAIIKGVSLKNKDLEYLLKDELNIKNIVWEKGKTNEVEVKYDEKLTPDLLQEGKARDLIRSIQEERKKMNCSLDQKIKIRIPIWPEEYEELIKKETLAEKIEKGEKLTIEL